MTRNMYNRLFWRLRFCVRCGRLNYVEPPYTTTKCKCSRRMTEHKEIPKEFQDFTGGVYNGPPRIREQTKESSSDKSDLVLLTRMTPLNQNAEYSDGLQAIGEL